MLIHTHQKSARKGKSCQNVSGELYIRDKPLIGHWVVDLLKSDFVQTICIISNAHFYNQFEQWYNQLEEKSRIVLLNDGSTSNETRLGAGKEDFNVDCNVFAILLHQYLHSK